MISEKMLCLGTLNKRSFTTDTGLMLLIVKWQTEKYFTFPMEDTDLKIAYSYSILNYMLLSSFIIFAYWFIQFILIRN